MSVLPETEHYEEGIYQLETTDPVVAGPDGISNLQAKQLASRTAWLKKQAEDLSTALSELGITDIPGLRDALDTQTNDTALVDERVDQLTADLNNLGIGNIRGLENKLIEHAGKDASLQQLLENLSQDLKGLGIDDIAELQSALDSNTTQTASIKQTVEQLQAGLSELSISDIANLQSTLDNNAAQTSSTKQAVDQLLADMTDLSITDISSLSEALNSKLDLSGKAADSNLLDGKSGDVYTPTGSIIAYAADTSPEGWLECNGATLSRNAYSKLFSVIGTVFGAGDGLTTFKLPDFRGEFLRGWSHGRSVDSGRQFGSIQGDAIRNISGHTRFGDNVNNTGALVHSTEGAFYGNNNADFWYLDYNGNGNQRNNASRLLFDASRVVPVANENRPRNRAIMYCIKY